MDAEIELKLFIQPQHHDLLIKILNEHPNSTPQGLKKLTNGYFDTDDLQLRRWDMGLRVRGFDNQLEQTIKTAGRVVGGIHSRPEYNVSINQKTPILSRFPKEIWPTANDLDRVSTSLTCIFETNFERQTWHIYLNDSLIEVALDVGEIIAQDNVDPICELEFELLAGDTSALIQLAMQVAISVPFRLGKASKAQRGYQLAGKSKPFSIEHIDYVGLPKNNNLPQALSTLLETGLERWQLIENILTTSNDIDQQSALWGELRRCVRLLRLSLNQFGLLNQQTSLLFDHLERALEFVGPLQSCCLLLQDGAKMLANINDKPLVCQQLENHINSMSISTQLMSIWQQPEYGQLQLTLVDLLLTTENGQHKLDNYPELGLFANQLQQSSWKRIGKLMPITAKMDSGDYQHVANALDESILVGFAYGEMYPAKKREAFRAPWQDLALGISTLSAYKILRLLSERHQLNIETWLDNKETSLLFAMEQSRKSALKAPIYW
ncbi:inorganic triphosphatase [Shewanella livingstonensis]|uniref:CYTH and CHAD domain-containing protein n=1 Tax=Shewanella livingstonensis TaxID=150120 RepID=A0A3G8LQK9_9GAMM|nr:CYTH and CHAD domain-containing protein [Shewanella livingstonensis]AZG72063.1 CYTH and CHAD domain-containing protein [Shewanella livingstonensis]